ncbi:antitoxin [Arcanobacterium hippocoleae]
MGIFDTAKDALNNAKDALHTQKAEELTDQLLDKGAEFAKNKLGTGKTAQIDQVRESIDKNLGSE